MASRAPVRVQRNSQFSSALSSAVSEWLLMLLLFLDGLFSYLVTKFARLCKLQTPCLLCSRLDHILGGEKPGFYKELICDAHKSEISSLAYCHVHQKLADVRVMCEDCLLSFATEKKSNSETYRSLVGKLKINLGKEENAHLELSGTVDTDRFENKFLGEDVVQVPLLKKDHALNSLSTRYCSCCNELFCNKSHAQILLQTKSVGVEVAELDFPILGPAGHGHLHRRDGLSKREEKPLGSPTVSHAKTRGFDRLSHIGYTELKITSDSESEVPLSDDDDGSAPVRGTNDLKEEFLSQCLQPEPTIVDPNVLSKTLSDDLAQENLIHTTSIMSDTSLLVPKEQFYVGEHHDGASLAPKITIAHGLEELNWIPVEGMDHPTAPSELISEVPNSKLDEVEIGDVAPVSSTASVEGRDHPPALTETVISEASNSKLDEVEIGDVTLISSTTSGEVSKALNSTETDLKQFQIINDPNSLILNHMDLNDAYKLAVGYKWIQPSPKDSSRVHEDLKLLMSQISAARGLEFPLNDLSPSPRVHGQGEDLKISDSFSSMGLQNLSKRFSIERNESGFESLDGSIVSEIEGEGPVDRLKRQVELDRKSMSLLYKELEEERSASAIAANQTMAMITRLQEEKAAMQMEALQYQRMMEEQAEYDQEALQKSNDLLAQKEKVIQDLEAVVESYKKQLGDESLVVKPKGDSEGRENNPRGAPLVKRPSDSNNSDQTDMLFFDSEVDTTDMLKDSLLDFADEKVYISECLKRLEKKLHLFSNNGVYVGVSGFDAKTDCLPDNVTENGQFSGKEAPGENCLLGEEGFLIQKDSSISREDSHSKAKCPPSTLGDQFTIEENHNGGSLLPKFDNERHQSSMANRDTDLIAIENEVSQMSERLATLEADRNFLEHTVNSLRNGNDGVRFIQEIASHLRELRRIGIRREQTVA